MAAGVKPGAKTRATQQSRTSKTVVNSDAKVKNIKSDPEGTLYRCTVCGKMFKVQKGNFFVSHSMLYEGNNGFITVCRACSDKYYTYLVDFLSGNEEKALDRVCSTFDWYYSDEIAASSKKISATLSRLSSYVRQMNLTQNRDKGITYLDTIRDRSTGVIDTIEDLEEINESGEKGVSSRLVKQWGFGYEPEEYSLLSEHYKVLTTQFTNADAVQDALIKDLCTIKVLQNRAMKKGDADSFDKFTKLYHSTLKAGGLKTRSETDTIDDESACWGNFIKDIETRTPADIYMDKSIFDDVDKVKEYFDRFILRPMKNFFSGTRVQDDEFSVLAGDDECD